MMRTRSFGCYEPIVSFFCGIMSRALPKAAAYLNSRQFWSTEHIAQ